MLSILEKGLLRVEPGLLIWTVITFIVLMTILWKAAWKPVVEALDARAEKVRSDIENADRSRQEAEKLLAQHKSMMDNAKNEAGKIISDSRAEAEKLKTEIIDKATADAKDVSDRAKREIELAKDRALADIKAEVVTLSTEIAAKIINKNLNPDDQKALVEETLNKVRTVQ